MIAWKVVGYDVKVNPVSERNEVLVGGIINNLGNSCPNHIGITGNTRIICMITRQES